MDKKNKNPNVPNLRFAGYIDNYRTCKLIDISEIVTRTNENNSEYPIMMISAGKGFIAQSEKYSRDNAGTSINKYVSTHLTTLGIFQASSRGILVH